MTRQCAAEFFGTFALVFAGTGAIVINSANGGVITHAGIALTFGLIVLAMIYTVGATAASLLLHFLSPQDRTLGMTLPAGGVVESFILEVALTLILMWVILSVSTGAQEKGITAGIAVGSVIALEGMFAGPISGASMNPARSLGPALGSLRFDGLWIYFVATTLGAVLAVPVCRLIRGPECCGPRARTFVADRPVSDRTGILRS